MAYLLLLSQTLAAERQETGEQTELFRHDQRRLGMRANLDENGYCGHVRFDRSVVRCVAGQLGCRRCRIRTELPPPTGAGYGSG